MEHEAQEAQEGTALTQPGGEMVQKDLKAPSIQECHQEDGAELFKALHSRKVKDGELM